MPLRLAVFDFDQTLSCAHVYYALAHGQRVGSIATPQPFALTERGQLVRLAQLDELPEFRRYGGFALTAFGGPERVATLKMLFQDLHANGVDCIVCSRGMVGPIRRCLFQVGLLECFSNVYANVGGSTHVTPFDRSLPQGAEGGDARFLGTSTNAGWGSKAQLIRRLMQERRIPGTDAVFIDDDPNEIRGCLGLCQTIQVAPPEGIQESQLAQLRALLPSQAASPNGERLPIGRTKGYLAQASRSASLKNEGCSSFISCTVQ